MSEHGHCPNCNADLDGGLIYDTMLEQCDGDVEKATERAASYGATPTKGQWGRQLGIYDRDLDRTVAYRCPDCKHEWSRR